MSSLPPLREHWRVIAPALSPPRPLLLVLDFDGTLTPIVSRPDLARLSGAMRRTLESLARSAGVTVVILSGRALTDLSKRVRCRGAVLLGNHGAEELLSNGRRLRRWRPSGEARIRRIENQLRRRLAAIPGLEIENKGPSLSVHTRRTPEAFVAPVHREVRRVARMQGKRYSLLPGKRVLEIRLRGLPTKGEAVRRVLASCPHGTLVLCFGDDVTDRSAFRAVGGKGWSVHVGPPVHAQDADFHVPSPREVGRVLRRILALRGVMPSRAIAVR